LLAIQLLAIVASNLAIAQYEKEICKSPLKDECGELNQSINSLLTSSAKISKQNHDNA
jgi:hypothetical protein